MRADAAIGGWLDAFEPLPAALGLFGGLSGMYAGTVALARVDARMAGLAQTLRGQLAAAAAHGGWEVPARDWSDYDLVSGPAGVVLALCSDRDGAPEDAAPPVQHLVALCDTPGLAALRIERCRDDPLRGWNYGRINTGVAHGVGGLVAALTAAEDRSAGGAASRSALAALCGWLLADAHGDARGLMTWAPAGRDGTPAMPGAWSRRQAWCYGTPGLAWALWDAGRVLGNAAVRGAAVRAMETYCAAFDEAIYLDEDEDEALAVCHGAAGIMLIADAFERHAAHRPAAALAARLEAWLGARGESIAAMSDRDRSLLSGSSGVVSALLTRRGGDRGWLMSLGLR